MVAFDDVPRSDAPDIFYTLLSITAHQNDAHGILHERAPDLRLESNRNDL